MKKLFFVAVLVLLSTVLFAQRGQGQYVYTSEGEYYCVIQYLGQYCGKTSFDNFVPKVKKATGMSVNYNVKITTGQWECIDKMMSRYQTTKGDTYNIVITWGNGRYSLSFTCEFTSNTQYNYWVIGVNK